MPKLATTHSLNDYPRLPISVYRKQLNEATKKGRVKSFDMNYTHHGNQYRYTVNVATTPCNYGGVRYWWLCPKCDGAQHLPYRKDMMKKWANYIDDAYAGKIDNLIVMPKVEQAKPS